MLLQASFNVWVENKKDILKELRLKPLRRHIFLYRKAMIFCKKTSSYNKGEYQFKGILKVGFCILKWFRSYFKIITNLG